MAFHKILVALDNSEEAEGIFVQALDLAHREESELLLFSCVQWAASLYQNPVSSLSAMPERDFTSLDMEMIQLELRRARERLEAFSQRAVEADVKAAIACDAGDPGALICQSAKAWEAELIVVGRRGHSGLKELMLGSVSSYVIHRANCSVLVIQGELPEADE